VAATLASNSEIFTVTVPTAVVALTEFVTSSGFIEGVPTAPVADTLARRSVTCSTTVETAPVATTPVIGTSAETPDTDDARVVVANGVKPNMFYNYLKVILTFKPINKPPIL
jgi:hypothetical protein